MTIKENESFKKVNEYQNIPIDIVLKEFHTKHLDEERKRRLDLAIDVNDGTEIEKVFWVDKGHPNGPELHCVTKKGVIFILNENKFIHKRNSLITILLARPNQVKRLYEEIHKEPPKQIIKYCYENIKCGRNK